MLMVAIVFYLSLTFPAESRQAMHGFMSTVKFTETRAYKAVLEKLNEHHHVVIIGRPGDGKTTLGLRALYEMQETEDCIPLIPTPPKLDLLPYLHENQKVSIFLDNLFGIYSLSGFSISRTLEFQIRSYLSKGNHLVISIRKDILLQCDPNLSKELLRKDVIVDLTDSNYTLLKTEKQTMLENALSISQGTVKEILSHERFSNEQVGFPQCLALMTEFQNLDFSSIFETPLKFVAQQLLSLLENAKNNFIVLVLAFVNDGQLPLNGDQFKNPCQYLPSDIEASSTNSQQLHRAAKSLVGTYLTFDRDKCQYVVNHETVMEGIALTLWENMNYQQYIISYCPERFLIRLSSKHTEPFCIPPRFLTDLFERLHCLLEFRLKESYITVASIELWDDPAVSTKLVHYLRSIQEQQSKHFKTYEGATLLVYAAMKGRINLTRLLLQSCVVEEDQLHLALNKASESGHLDVVYVLLPWCTKRIYLKTIFYAIKGGSVDIFEALTKQAGVIDYESKHASLQCTFFGGCTEIEVNILEEIILSGNLDLFLKATKLSQKSIPELINKNKRLVEFAAYSASIPLVQQFLEIGGRQCPHLLWWAAAAGSLEMFKFLMESGCGFNMQRRMSCNIYMSELGENVNELHAACLSGNSKLVLHICNTKPELLYMKDTYGDTPALLSPFSGSLEIVRYMDTHGNIKTVNDNGCNILHYAAQEGHLDIVEYIIYKYPGLLKMKDKNDESPFLCSGFSGSVELTEYLLTHNCDVYDKDSDGCTILHKACKACTNGKLTHIKHLVQNYPALLTMRNNVGMAPLHYAGCAGSVELLEYLISFQCDVLDTDSGGLTILHHACKENKLTLVKHIFENYPALLTVIANKGVKLIHTAGRSGSVELTEYLISQHCDVRETNSNGSTILHNACEKGKLGLVKYLLENYPALLTMTDKYGMTPLHCAGWSGSVDLFEYLITSGCDILDTTCRGRTILHYACQAGKLTMVKHLVENYPALLTIRDNAKATPLQCAGLSGSVELTEYLLTCHSDVLDTDSIGRTILHSACANSKLTLVKHLVENYSDLLTMRDNMGVTPLYYAVWSGSVELVEYLITSHYNVLDTDSIGRTILHIACQKGNLTFVKHLVENYPSLLSICDNAGVTPLQCTGWSGSVELTEYLITSHTDLLETDSCGRNILHSACQEGKVTLVKHLIKHYPVLLNMRDTDGMTALHRSGWSESIELIEYLITCHCDILDRDSDGGTILHIVCQAGNLTLVKHLVENYPALLSMKDNNGVTPLHCAGLSGSIELTEYLIACHCEVLDTDSDCRTILHIACKEGKLTLVKHLIENYQALVNLRDNVGLTPLHYAGWSGSVELTECLMTCNYDVSDTDSGGRTILHHACHQGKQTLAKHLVEKYPALGTLRDNNGLSPLHCAGFSGSIELTEYLIDYHCDIHDTDSGGRTILHHACYKDKLTLVKHLVENYPALMSMIDNKGLTPLHCVGCSGSVEMTEYLTNCHCDIADTDSGGRTILHYACQEGKLTLVKHLAENYQALLTIRDNDSMTPLHIAGWSGSVELTKYLITCHSIALDTDNNGWTILHYACQEGKLTLVKHLVENYPALLALRNKYGMTPLHTAGLSGSVELTEYLITCQCDVLDKNSFGGTILHHACQEGKLVLVKYLVECYPGLFNVKDNVGRTPLHCAGWSGSVELTEYLITRHCDVFDTNCRGRTILHTACKEGKLTLVKHLVENYPDLLPMRDNKGMSSLHVAGYSGSVDLTEYLIGCKCEVLDTDSSGKTILHHAFREGKLTLAQHLAENYPALLTMRDTKGVTPYKQHGCRGHKILPRNPISV